MEEMEITEEQRKRAEANRAAALAKRKAILSLNQKTTQPLKLVKCRKLSLECAASVPVPDHLAVVNQVGPKDKFRAKLEVCSPDSFSVTPLAVEGFNFPGEEYCFQQLRGFLSNVLFSHYTQNTGGGNACVYKLGDYQTVLRSLKNGNSIECEEIPWTTFNVIERLSHSFSAGKWLPCRPEHLPDEKVDELMAELPKSLLNALLPFQLDGVRFGLRRGGRCLIADEMGLGKTLQAISIAGCFIKEGSILVVCPAILRYSWAEELERWFPFCLPTDIHLVFGCKDDPARLPKRPRVVVTSYNMLRLLRRSMLEQEWITLIVDESHHLHSTKQSSEKDELTAVLDMAMKVKHLILLSGTPSLSRPYDIFHQVDMLWPGLLGHTKYEFAKTYCSVKFVRGRQGKSFKDFSKGIRLEELNVLLKQSVMIRRLKEHVLPQLPPKRRQIINLVLKGSDITLAMETLGLESGEASAVSDDETVHVSDEDKDNDMNKKLSKKLSALGIAKLPGFFEWLSIHPIMTEVDEEETREDSSSSHKMIIFGYHHKVLDGVQAYLCEKGIQFVRIDCNVIGSDRQSAVQRFQFSKEVKIALIGIRSGGSGLNLTAADTVVFLELPLRPADMQQAEDRAHRHGQKKLVNIYIFCAKDTVDESHWLSLNRSLLRVSSTLNGKCDALREIEVESVAYLETTGRPSEKSKQRLPEPTICNNDPEAKFVIVQDSSSSRDLQLVDPSTELDVNVNGGGEQHESNVISSWRNKLQFEGKKTTSKNYESATRAESETVSCSHSMEERNDDTSQRMKVGTLVPHTTLIGDGTKTEVELGVSSSFQETLRFEVSRNTGRTHLYSCIPGTDLRPKPLFVNFRLEEVECLPLEGENVKMTDNSVKDTRLYREAVMAFITEWKELRPIEKRKLIGKPLQLPLSYELCYLNESLNHDNRGLLNGGSKRRKTPKDEISCPLPTNAAWRKVNLYGDRGEKEKLYTQGWSDMDEPLCKLCQSPCKQNNGKVPQFFEDLFCSLDCFEEYRSRTSNKFLRKELFKMERGICSNCGLDCHQLVEHLRPLSSVLRQAYVKKKAPNIAERKKLLEKLVNDPSEGNAWHADHIIPVYKGGGECKLENMRTLCVACHADVTTRQCAERRNDRKKAKQQLKDIMNGLLNVNKSRPFHRVGQDPDDDNLLIDIPGSAYSEPNFIDTVERNEDIKSIQNGERSQLEHPTCDPQSACINSSNEASEVTAKAGKELQLLNSVKGFYDVTEALQVNENDKRDERNPSRQSMFSELKIMLGNDF